jgi:hypothetical protein
MVLIGADMFKHKNGHHFVTDFSALYLENDLNDFTNNGINARVREAQVPI